MRRSILFTTSCLLLLSLISSAFAQSTAVAITRLGPLTPDGRSRINLKAGEEFWGVGMVENVGGSLASLTWTMTLDGIQISYGGWTLPPAGLALFTSIASTTAARGIHDLSLAVFSDSILVVQSTTTIVVR